MIFLDKKTKKYYCTNCKTGAEVVDEDFLIFKDKETHKMRCTGCNYKNGPWFVSKTFKFDQ